MIVYVEYVLFNNFLINILILYLSLLLCKVKVKIIRLALSAIVGAVYSLFAPKINFSGDIILKILLAFLMCIIVSNWKIKKIASLIAIFLLITFALGGAIIGLSNLYFPLKVALFAKNSANIGIISGTCLVSIYLVRKIIMIINKKKIINKNVFDVIIATKNNLVCEKGYYDSGNVLYYNGIYPVIVADNSLQLDDKKCGSIKIHTVNGENNEDVYKLNYLSVNGKIFENIFYIKKSLNNSYKIILHNDTVREGNNV